MRLALPLALLLLAGCARESLFARNALTGREIVLRTYAESGGEAWRRPATLQLVGSAVVFGEDGAPPDTLDDYRMWRVFPSAGGAAHEANGQVRFEGRRGGARAFLLSYDGRTTYTADGPLPPSDADRRWASAFGFGAIRFAADDGFAATREADTTVDGQPAYRVRVTDPAGSETVFAIARDDHRVLRVGFATPRGWHERVYRDFRWVGTADGRRFRQPGALRLVYDGRVEREITWTTAVVNAPIDAALFSAWQGDADG